MAKNKVSEWSTTPTNNTDIGGINIAEGCAPSGINNAIRELMAQVKDMQSGTDSDSFVVGGNLTVSSTLTANSSVGTAGQVLASRGAGSSPEWTTNFITGMIMMWSGSIATIPSGWLLCNGANGTPDLRDKFVVGAGSTYAVAATGGAASVTSGAGGSSSTNTSSVVVGRDGWTTTGTSPGTITSGRLVVGSGTAESSEVLESLRAAGADLTTGSHSHTMSTHTHTVATLPPYYALAYIMKS